MVELDSLENCCGASHRGFESHSLRSERGFTRKSQLIFFGAVAQLGECIPRTDEVTGSNPVCSILNSFQLTVTSTQLKRYLVEVSASVSATSV